MKIEQQRLERKVADAERSEKEARKMAPQLDNNLLADACENIKTKISELLPLIPSAELENFSRRKINTGEDFRFFNVIPNTLTNADAFTGCNGTVINKNTYAISGTAEQNELGATCCLANDAAGVCRVVNQVKDGYHVSFFGYGFSGSGKTMTLFGNYGNSINDGTSSKEYSQPGIAQLAIANSNATNVALKSVFELASHHIDLTDKSFNSGIFIELFHQGNNILKTLPAEMLKSEEKEFANYTEQFESAH
ncbi:hypothetical protein BDK51DRAFT_28544 [Blyttiomyces helicus]|uniref:Kinesin motor domain-containing protein n=1 Tax=Blyttiomyces helicus TaxID=388810 RepID=A0A4P9WK36_9FUNG|nr:hypothetical protein BDK51DRAFT_28544 [Blyttiomyces helicus]|eukprot:RKO92752.1 hypothetical protein BDK51DRAFT_28544 [Blyttiomyces helicus]